MGFSRTDLAEPIVAAICEELQHGNSREKLRVSVLRAFAHCDTLSELDGFAPFKRVRILDDGERAGMAGAQNRPPWWVIDANRGEEWREGWRKGAAYREAHYDPEDPDADYVFDPVPKPEDE